MLPRSPECLFLREPGNEVKNEPSFASCQPYREEKSDVTLPWQQNFWITTRGSQRYNDGDGNENGEESNRLNLAKQQPRTSITLFSTFLSPASLNDSDMKRSYFTRPLYGVREHNTKCSYSFSELRYSPFGFNPLYYYMRNFCNLIGLEQWYFSLI